MLENLRTELGLGQLLSLDEIVVQLGLMAIKSQIRALLTNYKTQHELSTAAAMRPAVICAAAAAAATAAKPPQQYNKAALQELSGTSKKQLDTITKAMIEMNLLKEQKKIRVSKGRQSSLASSVYDEEEETLESSTTAALDVDNEDEEMKVFTLVGYYEWRSKMLKIAGIPEP